MSMFTKQKPKPKSEIFAALDIGTSKICCAIAQMNPKKTDDNTNLLKVFGVGYQLSKGLRGGNIIDMEALEESILNAVHAAEQMANKNINSVYVSVPGRWVSTHKLRVEISLSNTPVDETHIKRLLSVNHDLVHDATKTVLHVLPLRYEVDDVKGIIDPKGMVGSKLAVTLNIVTAPAVMIKNLISCIGRCHLDIAGFVAGPYASSFATLVPDEMTLGVTLIDIGAGQTTLSTFVDGTLTSLSTIPLGGMNITNDIARGLAAPISQAERLKTLYGTLIPSSLDDRENIHVAQLGEVMQAQSHHIPKGVLVHIIRSRVEEIFEMIMKRVKSGEVDPIGFQCLVLTGGVSQLQGIRDMAQTTFGKPVRLGVPIGVTGTVDLINTPGFSNAAGLLLYACQDFENQYSLNTSTSGLSVWKKIALWIRQNL